MKIYLILCLSLVLCLTNAPCANADDNDQTIVHLRDPDVNSPTYDGSTYNAQPSKSQTPEETQAEQEAQQSESTWLIRGYEERVKMDATARGESDSLDPFARISANKDLAKLAGLTTTTSPSPADVTTLHAGTDPLKDGPTIRLDPSETSSPQKLLPLGGEGFKPLITPLSAPDAEGFPNFYATLPAGMPPPAPADISTSADATPASDTPPVTDMPGIAAAQGHFSQGNVDYDLTLESLPDDFSNKQNGVSEDKSNSILSQLPSADAAKQLQLKVQVATTGKITVQPDPVKVVIQPDPELTPKPIVVPIIMAGRPQIQDPNNAFFR